MSKVKKVLWISDCGVLSYLSAFELQKKIRDCRIQKKIPDTFLFTSHPAVFTLGKRPCEEDFLSSRAMIQEENIQIIQSNRGGRITYHGPGQVVGYFIFDVRALKLSIPAFVRHVEEVLIQALDQCGLQGTRHPEYPGVWIGEKKIAALGLHFDRGISMHGFSINVNPNLKHYDHIVPCGIHQKKITSLQEQGIDISEEDLKKILISKVEKVFEMIAQKKEQVDFF